MFVFSGNYALARVLPQVYAVNREAIHGHVMALASLLPLCDTPEKISLLSLLGPIARNQPALLEASLPQLCDCLSVPSAIPATLQLLAEMAAYKASLLLDYASRIKDATESSPSVVCLAAQVIARIGQVNEDRGREALEFIVLQITQAENHNIPSLLREVANLCATHPTLLTERLVNKLESYVEAAPSVAKNIYQQMKSNLAAQRSGQGITKNTSNVTVLKVNGEHQQSSATNHHRLSLPLQGFSGNLSSVANPTSTNNRASLGGFVNVGNMSVPISVASAVFSGTPVYNSQGIPVLLTFGPGGLNITNPSTTTSTSNSSSTSTSGNRVVGSRTKQADASRSTPRLTPSTVPGSSAVAAAVMNRSMSWINAVHMNSTNRLSPSPAGPVLHKGNIARFGSSHQMTLGATPYGPSREAHGPGIHNPNQGGRGAVFASRGSRGSLSTNRVQVSSGAGATGVSNMSTSSATHPMRSVSGSLTTMKEDPEADLRMNSLVFGHNNPNVGLGSRDVSVIAGLSGGNHMSPSPTIALSPIGRIQNQTPISMIPSSLSSLAPSPPPIGQHGSVGSKMHDDMIHGQSSVDSHHHKASMNTLASQSTLSFHNSSVTISNPSGQQQPSQPVVVRRNHAQSNNFSGNPNGERNRQDDSVGLAASQRISVFEPYPMQDAVKHFCDKHLDKIKAYMERLMARLPLPVKCTIEERRSKKHAKVHFTCQGKSEYCLYGKSLFALKTKHPRLWIHLMFLALQVF